MSNKLCEKEKLNKNNIFWLKFFNSLYYFLDQNKLEDFIYFVQKQKKALCELKDKLKLNFKISDLELDAIIKSSIIVDGKLIQLKKDLDKDYLKFIPFLYYHLYNLQLEQILISFEENDLKGLKIILEKYIEMEKINE